MRRSTLAARVGGTYEAGDVLVRAGADLEAQHVASSAIGKRTDPKQSFDLIRPVVSAVLASAWLQISGRFGALETTAGIRGDMYDLTSSGAPTLFAVAPRLEERLRVSERLAVRAGAGLFSQPPTVMLALPASELAALEQGLQSAAHFEAGADVKLP